MFYSFEKCFTLFGLPLYSFPSVGVNRSVYIQIQIHLLSFTETGSVSCKRCLLFLFEFSVQPIPRGDHVLNFSDVEDMLKDEELK